MRDKVTIRGLLVALIFAVTASATALAELVTGTVSDDTGELLIGATVVLKGSENIITVTDLDGNYSLQVPDIKNGVLSFSYIGVEPKDVPIKGRTTVDVVLVNTATALDEVVVIGYGKQKKASIVGAITQASGEVLERAGGVSVSARPSQAICPESSPRHHPVCPARKTPRSSSARRAHGTTRAPSCSLTASNAR